MVHSVKSRDEMDLAKKSREIYPFMDGNLNTRNNKSHVTLLSRQYHFVLPATILVYALLQYYIGTYSNICSAYREPMSEAATTIYYCACACFFISGLQQAIKIHSYRNQSSEGMSRSIFFAGLTISVIAGSSSFLTGKK